MAAVFNQMIAGDKDVADARIAAGKNPAVESGIARAADEGGMLVIEDGDA